MVYEPECMYRIEMAEGDAPFAAIHLFGQFFALRRDGGKIRLTVAEVDDAHSVERIG